jgi:hypothetical protein
LFGLVIFSLLGYCFVIAKYWRWPVETTPFFIVPSIIGLLYIAGLLNILPFVASIIYYIGLLLFVWSLILVGKNPRLLLKEYLTPGIVCFILFSSLLWFKVYGATFSSWDEFIHWGLVSKDVFLTNGFVDAKSLFNLTKYPPGLSLFHYFIYRTLGFSEGITYFAQCLLLLAPLIVLFQGLSWKRWFYILTTMIFCYLILFVFSAWSYNEITGGQGPFLSVLPNLVLGVFFGIGLSSYYLAKNKDAAIIRLIPVIFCLPLIKGVGALFAGMIIVVIVVEQLIKVFKKRRRSSIIFIVAIFLLPMLLLFANHSASYLKEISVQKIFNTQSASVASSKEKVGKATYKDKEKIKAGFLSAVMTGQVGSAGFNLRSGQYHFISIPFWICLLLLLSIILAIIQRNSANRWRILFFSFCLLAGFAAYLMVLLLLYLYSYNINEAGYLAAFPRYVGVYLLGWCLVVYSFILKDEVLAVSQTIRGLLLVVFPVVLLFAVPDVAWIFLLRPTSGMVPIRKDIQPIQKYIKNHIDLSEKVYVLWQGVTTDKQLAGVSFAHKMLMYDLFPMHVNADCWNISQGSVSGVRGLFSCKLSFNDLIKKLKGYNYLFVITPDKLFVKNFRPLMAKYYNAKVLPKYILVRINE